MRITPRPFGQILGDATNALARVWKAVLIPALIVSIPAGVITIVAFSVTGGDEFMELALNNPDFFETLTDEELLEVLTPFYIAAGIALVVQTILSVILNLVAARAVALDITGNSTTAREVMGQGLKRTPRGLAAVLVIGVGLIILFTLGFFVWSVPFVSVGTPNTGSVLVAALLFVLLLGPGVWATISVSATVAAIGMEEVGVMDSIQRSIRLVRGRWWATAGYLLLVGLLGGIAVQLIQLIAFPFAAAGSGGIAVLIGALLGIAAQGVIVVLIGVAHAHWYVDLRARREDLTTEDLAGVGREQPPLPPAQPPS